MGNYLGALANYLLGISGRKAALQAFWKHTKIGMNFPTFNKRIYATYWAISIFNKIVQIENAGIHKFLK